MAFLAVAAGLCAEIGSKPHPHPAAAGTEPDGFGRRLRGQEAGLDAVAQVGVDFVERGNGHIHELRELGRIVAPESLGDVPWRGPHGVTQLIRKLAIGAGGGHRASARVPCV
jgi:hypothetical protein